jgi:hypothetical protein
MLNDRDRYTIGYRALRALVEDMLQPPRDADPERLRAALQEHLRLHCQNCGELIDFLPRRQGDRFCYACVAPEPTAGGR